PVLGALQHLSLVSQLGLSVKYVSRGMRSIVQLLAAREPLVATPASGSRHRLCPAGLVTGTDSGGGNGVREIGLLPGPSVDASGNLRGGWSLHPACVPAQ